MNKLMEIVGYILAIIGFVCIVKHIRIMHCKEGCCLCGWYKTKTEKEKPAGEAESHKIKVEDEKVHGSRYGSTPARY
ncbi:hypothetical protein [Methanosarcina sp.]|uniref:hypothetical protein n=1 Tax=Methanosarcina sp. TaxID=2213 RepID=UPI003C77DC55